MFYFTSTGLRIKYSLSFLYLERILHLNNYFSLGEFQRRNLGVGTHSCMLTHAESPLPTELAVPKGQADSWGRELISPDTETVFFIPRSKEPNSQGQLSQRKHPWTLPPTLYHFTFGSDLQTVHLKHWRSDSWGDPHAVPVSPRMCYALSQK